MACKDGIHGVKSPLFRLENISRWGRGEAGKSHNTIFLLQNAQTLFLCSNKLKYNLLYGILASVNPPRVKQAQFFVPFSEIVVKKSQIQTINGNGLNIYHS